MTDPSRCVTDAHAKDGETRVKSAVHEGSYSGVSMRFSADNCTQTTRKTSHYNQLGGFMNYGYGGKGLKVQRRGASTQRTTSMEQTEKKVV